MAEPVAPLEALEALEADATAEPEGVVVTLTTDDGDLQVPIGPTHMWFEGAAEDLAFGRVTAWVHKACEDTVVLDAWDKLRKRYRDLEAFIEEWSRLTGENAGKSPASGPSSTNTPRQSKRTSRTTTRGGR